jgi:hypothetical protein
VTASVQDSVTYYGTLIIGRVAERYFAQGKSWGKRDPNRGPRDSGKHRSDLRAKAGATGHHYPVGPPLKLSEKLSIANRSNRSKQTRRYGGVQPVERVYRVWVVPVRGVGGMDAVVKPTWRYLRRPLTGTAQTHRSDKRTTGYTRYGVSGVFGPHFSP